MQRCRRDRSAAAFRRSGPRRWRRRSRRGGDRRLGRGRRFERIDRRYLRLACGAFASDVVPGQQPEHEDRAGKGRDADKNCDDAAGFDFKPHYASTSHSIGSVYAQQTQSAGESVLERARQYESGDTKRTVIWIDYTIRRFVVIAVKFSRQLQQKERNAMRLQVGDRASDDLWKRGRAPRQIDLFRPQRGQIDAVEIVWQVEPRPFGLAKNAGKAGMRILHVKDRIFRRLTARQIQIEIQMAVVLA